MKTFIFLAHGFEEIEAITTIDILRRAEIQVTTVSISDMKEVRGAHNIQILADSLFSETDFTGNNLLCLPGGMPGTKNLDAHEGLKKLIRKQVEEGNKVAAICAAPYILGKMGLLNGKEATCYPGYEDQLLGATLSEETVVKAGNIITAKGAGVAVQFALKLVAELKDQASADRIAVSICC